MTDGRGWHNRLSDLRRLVEYHHAGQIEMIFTRQRLGELAWVARQILEQEYG